MLRVVHVVGGTLTGATRVVLNLLGRHDRSWIDPAVCFFSIEPADPSVRETVRALGVESRELVKESRYELGAFDRLAAAFRQLRCDVAVLHGYGAYGFGALAARMIGTPAIVRVEHSPELHASVHALVSAASMAWVDSMIAVSAHVRDYVVQHGTRAGDAEIIHNGIDLALYETSGAPTGNGVILCVARLDEAKDHPTLLEAMGVLRRRGVACTLRLAGDGPHRAALERQAASLGIADRVDFLGHRTDVPALLAGADLSVLSSHYEGLPLAAVESIAAGRALVASDVGGLGELIEPGRNGLLVAPRSPAALADALAELLGSRDRLRAMGEAARQTARARFGLDLAAARFDDHLRRVARRVGLSVEPSARRQPLTRKARA